MPVQKPSPHRFIAGPPPTTPTPQAKPKSNLRHAISAHTPKAAPEQQFKKLTPAKRFVVTPAHHARGDVTPRAPSDRVEEPTSSASTAYTPRLKAQRRFERVESIESASASQSQSSPLRAPEEHDDEDDDDVLETVEHEHAHLFAEDQPGTEKAGEALDTALGHQQADARHDEADEEILFDRPAPPRQKRRRSSSPPGSRTPTPTPAPASASTPRAARPPQPLLPTKITTSTSTSTSHRFRLPPHPHAHPHPQPPFTTPNTTHTHAPTPTTTTSTSTPSSRPPFILPPPVPRSPPKPSPQALPEIFSPSRKGAQKYSPGGWAATVQGWMVEVAGSLAVAGSDARRPGGRGDGVRLRVRVTFLGGTGTGTGTGGRYGDGEEMRESCADADGKGEETRARDATSEVECFAGGVVLAAGETDAGMYNASRNVGGGTQHGVRMLLAGQGGVRGVAGGVRLRVGDVVGVRAPTWEVDVGGEVWVVAVDWAVLGA